MVCATSAIYIYIYILYWRNFYGEFSNFVHLQEPKCGKRKETEKIITIIFEWNGLLCVWNILTKIVNVRKHHKQIPWICIYIVRRVLETKSSVWVFKNLQKTHFSVITAFPTDDTQKTPTYLVRTTVKGKCTKINWLSIVLMATGSC